MLKVNWDESTCQHKGVCINTLPSVFKIENGSFVVDSSGADDQQIKDTCDACPSGALTYSED